MDYDALLRAKKINITESKIKFSEVSEIEPLYVNCDIDPNAIFCILFKNFFKKNITKMDCICCYESVSTFYMPLLTSNQLSTCIYCISCFDAGKRVKRLAGCSKFLERDGNNCDVHKWIKIPVVSEDDIKILLKIKPCVSCSVPIKRKFEHFYGIENKKFVFLEDLKYV